MRQGAIRLAIALALSATVVPPQHAGAAGRCSTATGGVEQRVAAFWQCVGSLGAADVLTAEDLGEWARNVIERAPGAQIRVGDFRDSTVAMQESLDRASVGVPVGPPKTSDVEDRIARFWQRANALGSCDWLTAADLGQWALNVIDRDPSRRIRVDDFRAATAGMQTGLDRATAPCAQAAVPTGQCRGVVFDPAKTGIDGYVTWNLQPLAGIEVFAVAGENFDAPRVGTTTTDPSGYWKLTGFKDLDRTYLLATTETAVYDRATGTFNDLCANTIVRLDRGSGVQERYDSFSVRKFIDGVGLRPGAPAGTVLRWDPRRYRLSPANQIGTGSLTVSWEPLAGAQQYCIKLIDSTGGALVYGTETCLSGTSHTFSGLASGTSFSVHLLAWGTSRKNHDMIGNELIAFTVR